MGATAQQLYQGITVDDLGQADEPFICRVSLIDFSDDERALFPDETTIQADGSEVLIVELSVERSPDDNEQVIIRRWFPEGTDRTPNRGQLDAFGWQYLPASRSSAIEFMQGRRSPLRSLLESTDLGADKQALVETLDAFNGKLESNTALEDLRNMIAEHLSRSMPKVIDKSELTIRTTADPNSDVLEDVTLFLKRDEGVRALADQSDGVRQLMTMTFFDLAKSGANMVAIDEPELHLHASSQRTVAELFASGKNQRLLVTHSPYIVQRFEPKHVLVVTADQEVRQIPSSSFSSVEKEMANWWSPRLLEALTSRRTLVVEGIADRVFIEACARKLGVPLDKLGITVLELDGADKFKHVYNLLGKNGFDLDIIGLVDHAERGSWMSALSIKPKNINKKVLFVANADLEDEYALGMGGPAAGQALIDEGVCREQGILQAAGVSAVADLTEAQVAEFARDRKVTSAVAVGKHVTVDQIARMPAVSGLFDYIKSLDV
ncbi:hypothetical protein GCM10009563_09390 [Subtercola frigoramans]